MAGYVYIVTNHKHGTLERREDGNNGQGERRGRFRRKMRTAVSRETG